MQLSLLRPESPAPVEPESALDALTGLLAAGALLVRRGDTVRLSVIIPAAAGEPGWRVTALLAALSEAELEGEEFVTVAGHTGVRTAFTPLLAPLAASWITGAVQAPPAGFQLTPTQLRLWAIAAGHCESAGYQLGLAEHDSASRRGLELALRKLDLAATLVGPRAGGPAFRIVGARRRHRLAELLGPAPSNADWPA